jgi:hypothetical protein
MSYEVGSLVTMRTTVTDEAGAPTDTSVALSLVDPDGVVTSPAVTSDGGVGKYKASAPATKHGDWQYTFSTSGVIQVVQPDQFHVRKPGLRIVSLTATKNHLNKSLSVHADDDELRGFIDAAQVVIEDIVGPVIPTDTITEFHNGGSGVVILENRPVYSIVSVTENVGGTPVVLTAQTGVGTYNDYLLDPGAGLLYRRHSLISGLWPSGVANIEVQYRAGRNPVPANVRLAALEEVSHLWRNSQLARGGSRAAAGPEDILTASLAYSLPNRVAELLAPFARTPNQGS